MTNEQFAVLLTSIATQLETARNACETVLEDTYHIQKPVQKEWQHTGVGMCLFCDRNTTPHHWYEVEVIGDYAAIEPINVVLRTLETYRNILTPPHTD